MAQTKKILQKIQPRNPLIQQIKTTPTKKMMMISVSCNYLSHGQARSMKKIASPMARKCILKVVSSWRMQSSTKVMQMRLSRQLVIWERTWKWSGTGRFTKYFSSSFMMSCQWIKIRRIRTSWTSWTRISISSSSSSVRTRWRRVLKYTCASVVCQSRLV